MFNPILSEIVARERFKEYLVEAEHDRLVSRAGPRRRALPRRAAGPIGRLLARLLAGARPGRLPAAPPALAPSVEPVTGSAPQRHPSPSALDRRSDQLDSRTGRER